MRVAILGVSSAAGPTVARDLSALAEVEAMVLLDRDGGRARAVCAEHGAGKASAATIDPADRQGLTLVLEEYGLLVDAAGGEGSLAVMDACLATGCAYLGVDEDGSAGAQQLALDGAFAQQGLLAVLGCPASAAADVVLRYARGRLPVAGVKPFADLPGNPSTKEA